MNINIAYSCNEAYIQHTGISMISLFENNKGIENINVYFIAKDVTDTSITKLNEITEKYQRNLIIIPFEEICYDLEVNEIGRHIETIYAKLFFSRIKAIDKIIYLDSDVIVNGSLKELWSLNIDSYAFGCVKTITKTKAPLLGIDLKDDFYNDGVALVNVKYLRDEHLIPLFIDTIKEYAGKPPVLSEGVLNKVCKNKIYTLPPKYNFSPVFFMFNNNEINKIARNRQYYTHKEMDEARENPIIIHYLSGWYNRPWNKNCTHPLKEKYLYFKSISPWAHTPLFDNKLSKEAKRMKILYKLLPIAFINFVQKIRLGIKKYFKYDK